jgi:hypothetical protein
MESPGLIGAKAHDGGSQCRRGMDRMFRFDGLVPSLPKLECAPDSESFCLALGVFLGLVQPTVREPIRFVGHHSDQRRAVDRLGPVTDQVGVLTTALIHSWPRPSLRGPTTCAGPPSR